MDAERLRRLSRVMTAASARRDVMRSLAALPLLGATGMLLTDTEAKGKSETAAERKRRKRRWFCLNEQSIRARNKKKKKKLKKRGAKRGKCIPKSCTPDSAVVTCATGCGQTANNCGEMVSCGFVNVAPNATPQTTFGQYGTTPSDLWNPYNLTISADQLIAYIPDYSNDRISIWTRPNTSSPTWTNLTTFSGNGTGSGFLDAPADLVLSANELTMWIADFNNDRISVWSRPDANTQTWGNISTFGSAYLNGPNAIAMSDNERMMWVVDRENSRIVILTRPNKSAQNWSNVGGFGALGTDPNQFSRPSDLALSADELTLWIADQFNDRISIWTRPNTGSLDWTNIGTFGVYGQDYDQFYNPYGVTLSQDERTMWVSDSYNSRISIWSRQDTSTQNWQALSTFGTYGLTGDDTFNRPAGLVVSPDSATIWIADTENHRISVWNQTCPA
ncbi:MAG: NHL repeat-containing protein [Thermomicrobiales bacterium]